MGESFDWCSSSKDLNTIFDVSISKDEFVIDENNIVVSEANYDDTNVVPLYLFGRNTGYSCDCISAMKLYSFKIYEGDIIVLDCIPCYNSSNIFGLYDVVGENFYTNQGVGIFNYDVSTYMLQGSSTQKDPNNISSLEDLTYLSYISQINTSFGNGKYFILTKDIVLNDGYFEEDGTYHDGGDGKLYEWIPMNLSGVKFDGKNHIISGLYKNSLLNAVHDAEYKNLHIKNAYVNNSRAIFSGAGTSYNIVLDKISCAGYLASTQQATGAIICQIVASATIKNCVNYAKITNTQERTGGIVGYAFDAYVVISNCVNEGEIVSSSDCVGGIIGDPACKILIEYSKNKAKIVGESQLGGIVGRGYYNRTEKIIVNCENSGDIEGSAKIAGILGNVHAATNIAVSYCKNSGNIKTTGGFNSGIVGYIGTQSSVEINNCENSGNINTTSYFCGGGIVGMLQGGSTTINYCINRGDVDGYRVGVAGIVSLYSPGGCSIRNCINAGKLSGTEVSGIACNCAGYTVTTEIENCYNIGELPVGTTRTIINSLNVANITNSISDCKVGSERIKHFYGSDFSGFHYDRITGELKLNAFEGIGIFQGKVTSDWLIGKGFVNVG